MTRSMVPFTSPWRHGTAWACISKRPEMLICSSVISKTMSKQSVAAIPSASSSIDQNWFPSTRAIKPAHKHAGAAELCIGSCMVK
ncbi:hypothetical protein C4D60_Mb04t27490 [Musa balbisiana]|uniref:Uncharacterized protein n=1 Tax=Musa balbisiana TaxID=52838 RepID=A0A4S8KF62_MUSBA|nr:hypothetical protein C4D60_Mb04t27490 [Musa balbisiana]